MSQLPESAGADDADSGDESDDSAKVLQKLRKAKAAKLAAGKTAPSTDVYVPPKHMAVHYDDDTKPDRARKQMEWARKRALGSSLIQELKEEYLDTPVEISSSSRAIQKFSRKEREREEYEEKYLMRLPMTKADKHRSRKMTTMGECYAVAVSCLVLGNRILPLF